MLFQGSLYLAWRRGHFVQWSKDHCEVMGEGIQISLFFFYLWLPF